MQIKNFVRLKPNDKNHHILGNFIKIDTQKLNVHAHYRSHPVFIKIDCCNTVRKKMLQLKYIITWRDRFA